MSSFARERILRLVLRLLYSPYRYNRRDLAEHFGKSVGSIDGDIEVLKTVGIGFVQEGPPHYRCAIEPSREFKELGHLLPMTTEEKAFVQNLLEQNSGSSKQSRMLINKLNSLYDFQKLGLDALRKPQLDILDKLEEAIKLKRCVVLQDYRSNNSNTVRDRLVEPFDLNPEFGILQAYDLEKSKRSHFALRRIARVELLNEPWTKANHHRREPTDVFRIVSPEQVRVHFLMDVFAYNLLVEQFPQTKLHIMEGSQPNTYDFDGKVNAKFYGLLNFILANATHIELYEPLELKQAVKAAAEAVLRRLEE